MNISIIILAFCLSAAMPVFAKAADVKRQADVTERGKDVMPFDLKATVHIFTKSPDGGIQRVVARRLNDTGQIKLIRGHLKEIRAEFLRGDFSGPSKIHGDAMPGLADLKAAKPGQISVDYDDVEGGGELTYKASDEKLTEALHKFFDAQLTDHGSDAMEGHKHNNMQSMPKM